VETLQVSDGPSARRLFVLARRYSLFRDALNHCSTHSDPRVEAHPLDPRAPVRAKY